jgi:hypothetical protein
MDIQTQRTVAIVVILLAVIGLYAFTIHSVSRDAAARSKKKATDEDARLRRVLREELGRRTMSTTSTKRAREWLASARPILTWAPLAHAGALHEWPLLRHAWPLPVAGILPTHTACGMEAAYPIGFSDDSRTPDCEKCRDVAAAPLAALIDEARAAEREACAGESAHLRAEVITTKARLDGTTSAIPTIVANHAQSHRADLGRFIAAYEAMRLKFGDEYEGRFAECDRLVELYLAGKPLSETP